MAGRSRHRKLIEAIEDRIDTEEGLKALEELRAGKDTTVPFAEVAKKLGLRPARKAAKRAKAARR